MKNYLLAFTLLFASFNLISQDHWDSIITNGVRPNKTEFDIMKVFKNKIYVAGADSMGLNINAYSSATGNHGSFTVESGLNAVLQGGNETNLTAATTDANFMFYGSSVTSSTVTSYRPQVYKFDGTTYSSFGTIPHYTTGVNSVAPINNPFIGALALYSPTGASDSIYAFVNPDSLGKSSSVWKSPTGTPNWIPAGAFSAGSGITAINDAIVWHKRLYIAANGRDSMATNLMHYTISYILSTSNGIKWDTVAKSNSLFAPLTYTTYQGVNFNQLEVHQDTLFAALSGNPCGGSPLFYTTDSLISNPAFHSAGTYSVISGNTCWTGVYDLQSAWGKLWMVSSTILCFNGGGGHARLANSLYSPQFAYGFPDVMFRIGNQMYHSSQGTGVESTSNISKFSLAFFNNGVFTSGTHVYADLSYRYGVDFRLTLPHAVILDSTAAGTGNCTLNNIYLNSNSSTNAYSAIWKVNGSTYSHSLDTTFFPTVAGTYTIGLKVFDGTFLSNFTDSTTTVITVHQSPIVDSVKAVLTSVCQGQPDTLLSYLHAGTAPYTYTWQTISGPGTYTGSPSPIVLTTVSTPSPTMISFTVKDFNNCLAYGSTVVSIFVHGADSLSGLITLPSHTPVTVGTVYLFKKKFNHVGLADSSGMTNIGTNGKFSFPRLFYGDYYIKAVADTITYPTTVGTYYSNRPIAFQWDSALVIQQHTCTSGNDTGKNVTVLQYTITTGPGTISGQITDGSGYGHRYSHNIFAPQGAPLKGVDVKLGRNPGGNVNARTTTDNSGNYSFHGVPLGNYKIYVDIPNYGMDSIRAVSLIATDTNSINNNYFVDSTKIYVTPSFTTNASASICQGDSIRLGTTYLHSAGIYHDTLHTVVNGFDSLVNMTLSVNPLPTLTLSTSADTICVGGNVTLTAAGTASTYTWSVNAGSANTTSVSLSPSTTSVYTVNGSLGTCMVSRSIIIMVESCAGIARFSQTSWAVFPNPADGQVTIMAQEKAVVRLISITGQVFAEMNVSKGSNLLSVSSFAPGAYQLVIISSTTVAKMKLQIVR